LNGDLWISQRKRKRVEEISGWMKSWGGLRGTRFRGIARVQLLLMSIAKDGTRTQRPTTGLAGDINMLINPSMLIGISRFASSC
jgi:hypothetical protein